MGVSLNQLANDLEHGLLHLRVEDVVVRSPSLIGLVHLGPASSVPPNPCHSLGVRSALAQDCLQFRHRSRELQRRYKLESFPIK